MRQWQLCMLQSSFLVCRKARNSSLVRMPLLFLSFSCDDDDDELEKIMICMYISVCELWPR